MSKTVIYFFQCYLPIKLDVFSSSKIDQMEFVSGKEIKQVSGDKLPMNTKWHKETERQIKLAIHTIANRPVRHNVGAIVRPKHDRC